MINLRDIPQGLRHPRAVPSVDPSTLSQKTLFKLASLKYCYNIEYIVYKPGAVNFKHSIQLFPTVSGHPQNTYEYSEPLDGGPVAQPQLLTEGQVFRVETGETLLLPCRTRNLGNMVLLWKKGSRVLTAGTIKVNHTNKMKNKLY